MRSFLLFLIFCTTFTVHGQPAAQKIFDTERAFERAVVERGMNAAFVEFMAPNGVMFMPAVVNARKYWTSRPPSPAHVTWNPIVIGVGSNGILAYSIGNSVYRANGKNDTNESAGHYLSIWQRQPNGEYRAVLDAGITHEKPTVMRETWKSSAASTERNEKKLSAADSSTSFFETVANYGAAKAYKSFLADDAIVMREGKQPFFGKKAAVNFFSEQKQRIQFAKRKSFVESADLGYVYNSYTLLDKTGTISETGNYIQIWQLRAGVWRIVVDMFLPIPPAK